MRHVDQLNKAKWQLKGCCLTFIPLLALAFFSMVGSLSFTFADSQAALRGGDYWSFAQVSNSERIFNKHDCRKYGGRPVSQGEHALVMGRGRTDARMYNVLWFGQHQYVTYKIDDTSAISRFFGLRSHKVWLCQF